MPSIDVVEKAFPLEAFADVLRHASRHCYEVAAERYCEGPLPPDLLYYAPELDPRFDLDDARSRKGVPRSCVKTFDEIIPLLRRDDGFFRDWINLSPEGTDDRHTFLEVIWADRWTNRLIVGEGAFPFEPFHILGPALPADWREGDPIPRVALPRLECLPDEHDWEHTL